MIVVPWSGPNSPLAFEVIQHLGLTPGLKLCLDAGDAASYSGSGQSWLDRSGNGYDFFRGANNSATTDDPTFNGVAGALSAYWSFDGGDFFTYDSANETWMQNIHKDNARFALLAWFYNGAAGSSLTLAGDSNGSSSQTGFRFGITAANNLFFAAHNGSGSPALSVSSAATISGSAWHLLGVSIDEAAGTGLLFIDGASEAFTSTYSSPASGNAGFTFRLAQAGNGGSIVPNGSRLAVACAWEGSVLAADQAAGFFQATRGRLGV